MKPMKRGSANMHELPLNTNEQKQPGFFARLANFTRSKSFSRGLVIGIGSVLCLVIFIVTITPKRYNLYVGMVPNQTIAANKDVVDEITTTRNREAAAQAVTPIYHYQDGITEMVMQSLDNVYAQLLDVRQYALSLPDYSPNRTYSIEEYDTARGFLSLLDLENFQLSTLMNATSEQIEEMYAALSPAIRNTMQGNVTQGQESIAITAIMQVVGFKTNVSLLQNLVLPILRQIILPNMVVDEEATQNAREAAYKAVEPVVYKQGQNIVVAGEGRIRENQIDMLNTLGLLSDNSIDYAMYLGAGLLLVSLLTLLAGCLALFARQIFADIKRLVIIYLVIIISMLLTLLAKSIGIPFFAPLILPFMLLTVTLGVLPGLMVGLFTGIINVLMLTNGAGISAMDQINLLVMSAFSGALSSMMLHKKYERSSILFAGALASLVGFAVVFSLGLMTSMSLQTTLNKALWATAGSAINALLCLSFQPAIESIFNLPTPMRLLDLTNPNNPLMRRLLMEAPGTFHHSIIIANLAEAAAEAIGANPLLARAGAYFHDIGKLKRPMYFKENQIGTSNIHDTTDPKVSAAIIISHVREGLDLAKKHRLPCEIQQIIAEHHGDSLVAYFYNKALKSAEGKQVDEADFRYPGIPPQTAEGALVMICDTVEAAIRTLSSPTKEEIVSFIEDLIQKKVQSGMLINSPLTLKQLELVRNSCASVIYGVFHERIEYPDPADKLPSDRIATLLQQMRSSAKTKNSVYPPIQVSAPHHTSEIDIISPPAPNPLSTPDLPKPDKDSKSPGEKNHD